MPVSTVLLSGIGPRQEATRSLQREVHFVKPLAHMAGMVGDARLAFEHLGNHRRGPYSTVQPIGYQTTVQNVLQSLLLRLRPAWRPSRTVPFHKPSTP